MISIDEFCTIVSFKSQMRFDEKLRWVRDKTPLTANGITPEIMRRLRDCNFTQSKSISTLRKLKSACNCSWRDILGDEPIEPIEVEYDMYALTQNPYLRCRSIYHIRKVLLPEREMNGWKDDVAPGACASDFTLLTLYRSQVFLACTWDDLLGE